MKEPWTVFLVFWMKLAELGSITQHFLIEVAWAASPSRFYKWICSVIDFCRNAGVPTFDQPSWLVIQEVLDDKAEKLAGTAVNASLTQIMDEWSNYNYEKAPPPNPYIPYAGPYMTVVGGYDKISGILRSAAGRLFAYEDNQTLDFAGRTVTNYEAADIIWYVVLKMTQSPLFQMRDPYVPKWFMPFPWLEYCEKDLRKLKDFLKEREHESSPIPDPEEVPWSMHRF